MINISKNSMFSSISELSLIQAISFAVSFSVIIFCISVFPSTVRADETSQKQIGNTDEIIEECWAVSEELRSTGNTNSVRAGHLETALCLEKAIIDNASEFIDPDFLNREQITVNMEQVRFAVGGLYWSLYNSHLGCETQGCGTIWQVFHNNMLSHVYEEILRRVIEHRKVYNR